MITVADLGRRAKTASRVIGTAPTDQKASALQTAAELLEERAPEILTANQLDLQAAEAGGMAPGPLDRLRLTDDRLASMADGLRQVAGLADPVGDVLEQWTTAAGLDIEKVRVPLGVIAIVYENRPNVTSDAGGLCLMSGNAALLRGSATALESNRAVTGALRDALVKVALPEDAVVLVDDPSHDAVVEVMRLTDSVDCLIPRGGPDLVGSVRENATVPVIIDGDGNCHVYVDAAADLEQALAIVVNAKIQRPSVCNAAESLVVHEAVAAEFVPRVAEALAERGVTLVGDEPARALAPMGVASEDDFGREFLDLKLSVAVVPSLEAGIAHVNRYGTGHTEVIITRDDESARRFTTEVDAAVVMVNASSRFTDGERFGFGAEIGISTQKLHARGPMALRELTTYKYVVHGDGQVVS